MPHNLRYLNIYELASFLFFCILTGTILVLELFSLVRLARNKLLKKETGAKPWKIAIALHTASALIILSGIYAYLIEPYRIDVKHLRLETSKLKKEKFRVIQLSDTHFDKKPVNEAKITGIINSLRPDAVLFTGDALNTISALERFRNFLGAINTKHKYAVLGNVDVKYYPKAGLFDGTGFKNVDGKGAALSKNKEKIFICGLNYTYWRINPAVFTCAPKEAFSLFLYHSPALVNKIKNNFDLYLCGHTHGGQIALPIYGAIVTFSRHGKKYEAGRYNAGKTIVYVNRGLGMEGGIAPRIRFLAAPEITVFDIVPENNPTGEK